MHLADGEEVYRNKDVLGAAFAAASIKAAQSASLFLRFWCLVQMIDHNNRDLLFPHRELQSKLSTQPLKQPQPARIRGGCNPAGSSCACRIGVGGTSLQRALRRPGQRKVPAAFTCRPREID